MKKLMAAASAMLFMAMLPCFGSDEATPPKWSGVDETVVEKYAEKAGRPARKPFINTDQGDLLLFVFLVAGAAGGFVGGYYYRELFPAKKKRDD